MQMPKPKNIIYMCQQRRPPNFPKPSCVREGSEDLFPFTQQKMMELGIDPMTNWIVPTGCLNRCSFGPVMIVEPGSYMYVDLTKEKIERILKEHIIEGNPIKEYLIPEEFWA
ncbi:MAG: (2Fe-2S) ferredoxin domain-containing protein [Nautiliaceae bacterium]